MSILITISCILHHQELLSEATLFLFGVDSTYPEDELELSLESEETLIAFLGTYFLATGDDEEELDSESEDDDIPEDEDWASLCFFIFSGCSFDEIFYFVGYLLAGVLEEELLLALRLLPLFLS